MVGEWLWSGGSGFNNLVGATYLVEDPATQEIVSSQILLLWRT